MESKKSKSWLPILIILGLVAFGGAFGLGLLGKGTPDKLISDLPEKPTISPEVTALKEEPGPSIVPSTEPGLVAYYPFDKDTQDYSGEGNDGDNSGAPFVTGKSGQALSFNGKDSFVYSPININPVVLPQMTMAAWVKTEDDKGVRQIISHDNGGYDRAIGMDSRGGGQGWSCFAGNGRVLGSHPIAIEKWTFVAAVYDQEAETVKLYVDGSVYEKEGKLVGDGNDFVLIGARGSIEGQSEYFMGAIDEVRIYDYALSDEELKSLHQTGVARP